MEGSALLFGEVHKIKSEYKALQLQYNVESSVLLHIASCLKLVARTVGWCCSALLPTYQTSSWCSCCCALGCCCWQWWWRDSATPHFISLPVTISPDSLFQSHLLHHHHFFLHDAQSREFLYSYRMVSLSTTFHDLIYIYVFIKWFQPLGCWSAQKEYLVYFDLHTDPVSSVVPTFTLCSSSAQPKYIFKIQQKHRHRRDVTSHHSLSLL